MLSLFKNKRRILLLDDDSAMQRLVSLLLRRKGFKVDVVSQGNQAIELLQKTEYDAMLLDLMMPHEGGMTVIRHLRTNRPELLRKVILITGAPDTLLQSYDGEIFGVVRKPFEDHELTAKIESLTGD